MSGRWRQAVTAAGADGTFFIAQAYHCAVAESRRARLSASAHTDFGFKQSGDA
jgi:hypothetical protein